MARRIIELVEIEDDVTGQILNEEDADSIRFTIDGVTFDLDTSKDETDKIREFMAKYIAVATPVTEAPKAVPTARKATAPVRTRTAGPRRPGGAAHTKLMARTWLQGESWEIGDRGRIPAEGLEAYAKAHGITVDEIV